MKPGEEETLERLKRYRLLETMAEDPTLPKSFRVAAAEAAQWHRKYDAACDAEERARATAARAWARRQEALSELNVAAYRLDAERAKVDRAEEAGRG